MHGPRAGGSMRPPPFVRALHRAADCPKRTAGEPAPHGRLRHHHRVPGGSAGARPVERPWHAEPEPVLRGPPLVRVARHFCDAVGLVHRRRVLDGQRREGLPPGHRQRRGAVGFQPEGDPGGHAHRPSDGPFSRRHFGGRRHGHGLRQTGAGRDGAVLDRPVRGDRRRPGRCDRAHYAGLPWHPGDLRHSCRLRHRDRLFDGGRNAGGRPDRRHPVLHAGGRHSGGAGVRHREGWRPPARSTMF